MKVTLTKVNRFEGQLSIPGDKSISHRSLLFGGLAEGRTEITGLSDGEDVRSSGRCLEGMGVRIERSADRVIVEGHGLRGLKAPLKDLDCGNSGTTMRMLMGILCGQTFTSRLVGDASLSRRPMKRVAEPLAKMGAHFSMTEGTYAPLEIKGTGKLSSIDYDLKVASAQVKSAVMMAGLYANGVTTIRGLTGSRDHTERLLPHFGILVSVKDGVIQVAGGQKMTAAKMQVPGDPSSAAFWCAGACLVAGGHVEMKNMLLNPTRTGFLKVLRRMGARIEETIETETPEPVGTINAYFSKLRGTEVQPEEVPSLIDEIPMLAVLGVFADGETVVRGAEELRIKETDRIEAVAVNLRRMGAEIETFPDGFRVRGPQKLKGAALESFHDHRIAMAFAIGACAVEGETTIDGAEACSISYPSFFETLKKVTHA